MTQNELRPPDRSPLRRQLPLRDPDRVRILAGDTAVPFAIRIVQEYERGVIFRLGRLVGARGPGLFFILPFIESMVKIDLRIVTMDVPRQDVITRTTSR